MTRPPVLYHVTIVRTYVDVFDVAADSAEDARGRAIDSLDGPPADGVTVIGPTNGDRLDLPGSVVVVPRVLDSHARIVFYLFRWVLA